MPELHTAIIYLSAAVLAVPLFKRFGLGAVLGYLVAGIAIGPAGLALVGDVEHTMHFAEMGVVLLLFIIGLELQPSRLWQMRNAIFVWGSVQLLGSALLVALAALAIGHSLTVAVVIGLSLALSSTAFALQMLAERKELNTQFGQAAFAILLFQDIAVVPLLAIVPLLGESSGSEGPLWIEIGKGLGVILVLIVLGRYFLRYALRMVANSGVREVLTATALLTVLGAALLVEMGGLSMALGAFIAGMLMADSEYRHQLEADIEPFKGLLLGLFFISVGMSVDLSLVLSKPGMVIGAAVLLVAIKSLVLYGIGRARGFDHSDSLSLALTISQGGEFAFVLFGVGVASSILSPQESAELIVAVTLSMAITPILLQLRGLLQKEKATDRAFDTVEEQRPVIIAGFGRFGQIVARILRAKGIPFTALEISPRQVDFVGKFGSKIYFGDATRLDLLQAAHAANARAFVVAVDDADSATKITELVHHHFPTVPIYARARDRRHIHELFEKGAKVARRETIDSALNLTKALLPELGLTARQAQAAVDKFHEHDIAQLQAQHEHYRDEDVMMRMARSAAEELRELFEQDEDIRDPVTDTSTKI